MAKKAVTKKSAKSPKGLAIVDMLTSELIPYAGNARKHDAKNVAEIASSISEYGFNDPIALNEKDNIIIEGHGRLLAAKKLGMETVPVIKLGHMTAAQIKGYTLIHNRLAEKSEWDKDVLKVEISKLADMDVNISDLGFSTTDLADMDICMDKMPDFRPGHEGEQGKLDAIKRLECPHCGESFEKERAKTVD